MSDFSTGKFKGLSKSQLPTVKANNLNDDDWQVAGIPLGDGNFWIYQDRNTRIEFGMNEVEIDINRFSRSHDNVQIFDNPKHLFLTKSGFEPGSNGLLGFTCNMKSKIINGDLQDYKDCFCAFNVLDFGSALVFDIVSNGRKVWVIYERLHIPGLTTIEESFTKIIPINLAVSPDAILECGVIYDRINDSAEYYIDGKIIFRVERVPVKIDRLQTGFGIITLHPIENGRSVSCKGQGGRGVWGGFAVWRTK
jgi:hypothetical protein